MKLGRAPFPPILHEIESQRGPAIHCESPTAIALECESPTAIALECDSPTAIALEGESPTAIAFASESPTNSKIGEDIFNTYLNGELFVSISHAITPRRLSFFLLVAIKRGEEMVKIFVELSLEIAHRFPLFWHLTEA